uniref:G_PROTEIN_RECEP_F1_2 domain-containing protein n=1 Tax=Caenorhabditis japonica TaxID=281687 RepID=A0A8R1IEH2_CAEJA
MKSDNNITILTTTETVYTDYDYDYPEYDEEDIYKKVYNVSTRLNIYLQMFTVVSNIIHLTILTRKDLRSISIFILMIAICISDIVNFFLDFYQAAVEIMWLPNVFPGEVTTCLREDYTEVNPGWQAISTVTAITRRLSVWLAILLVLIRTLSVMFPMNQSIQKLVKPKAAVWCISGAFLFWLVYSAWPLVTFRIFWLPDNMNKYCQKFSNNNSADAPSRYLLVAPAELPYLMSNLGFLEGIIKVLPAILYPILTVLLIFELRTIKKRRQNIKKEDGDKSDNTTKLLLFMTIMFTLSEGLAGVLDFLLYNLEALMEWNEDVS